MSRSWIFLDAEPCRAVMGTEYCPLRSRDTKHYQFSAQITVCLARSLVLFTNSSILTYSRAILKPKHCLLKSVSSRSVPDPAGKQHDFSTCNPCSKHTMSDILQHLRMVDRIRFFQILGYLLAELCPLMSSMIRLRLSEPRKSVHVCGFCLKNVGGRPPWGRRLLAAVFCDCGGQLMFSIPAVLWVLLDISWYSFYTYRFLLYNHQTSQAISASLTKLDWNVTIECVGRECDECVCVCF